MNTFILILIWSTLNGEINIGYEGGDQPTLMNQNECNVMLEIKSKEATSIPNTKWALGGCIQLPGDKSI